MRPTARGLSRPPNFIPFARLPADPTFEEIEAVGGVPVLHNEAHAVADDTIFVSGEIERKTVWETGIVGAIRWVKGEWQKDEVCPAPLSKDLSLTFREIFARPESAHHG